MKRYNLGYEQLPSGGLIPRLGESETGEWVKYEDVKQLILRNELLVQALFPRSNFSTINKGGIA